MDSGHDTPTPIDPPSMEPAMRLALEANFGSLEHWRRDFIALAAALRGGAGSLLLGFDPHQGTLVNRAIAEGGAAPVQGVPVLTLDLPAASAGEPVRALVARIDWAAVYRRYQEAVYAASEAFAATPDDAAAALLLDVRRAGVFANAGTMLPGARWRDPAAVATWAAELPADREVLVYCVYGHEVGRATAMRLRAAGLKARFLSGGIDAWVAAGRPVMPKGEGA